MTTKQELQDQIYELQVELQRNKKLLGQCMERQSNPKVMLGKINQDLLDRECLVAITATHNSYRKIFGGLYWKKDLEI
tara:strand:- start:903 stop:1136 length:234 start_codon:yes stop_codon:yes gene_type:complete